MIDSNRIVFVDALRGYALMGLFLIHMVEYFEIYWLHPEPGLVHTAMFGLFGGKAYAIFALLFGLSFYIILQRRAQSGQDFRGRFAWRVTLLLAMGYLHGLLYGGDILQLLAIAGFIVLPLWHAGTSTLLFVAIVCLLQVPTLLYFIAMDANLPGGYTQPFFMQFAGPVLQVYGHGGLGEVIGTNAIDGTLNKWAFMIESGRVSNIVGMAVLGCYLGRIAYFSNDDTRSRSRWISLGVLVAIVALLIVFQGVVADTVASLSAAWLGNNVVNTFTNNVLALATIVLLLLLYQWRYSRFALRLLAAPGRMSLTMYVAQSVLFVPIFYGFGLNAHAWIGQWRALALGIACWVVLVALAHVWMRRFHYGPLEWLWRAATLTDRSVPFRQTPR